MGDESYNTIEQEIQAVGERLFGSKRSALEDRVISAFAKTREINVVGEDFPEWFDDKDERYRIATDFNAKEKWPFQNKLRLDPLLRFLELDLVQSFANTNKVNISSALLESPSETRRSLPFALRFNNCRWVLGLYLRELDVSSLEFHGCSGDDLTIRKITAEWDISISDGLVADVWLKHVNCQSFILTGCETWHLSADYVQAKNDILISVKSSDLDRVRSCYLSRVTANRGIIEYCKADRISLLSAQISKYLEIKTEICLREGVDSAGQLDLYGSKVGGELRLEGVVAAPDGTIDLTNVTADMIVDGAKTWPTSGTIRLSGLQYREIRRIEPLKRGSRVVDPTVILPIRMEWLNRQSDWHYSLHPYRQLADSFVAQGQTRLAARVMSEGTGKLRRHNSRGIFAAIWTRILGATTGHGYRPELSLWWLGLFLAIGAAVFHVAYKAELMAATTGAGSPTTFNAIVYSLDALVPIIDFDQAKYWVPHGKGGWGVLIQIYGWVHTLTGWSLASLAVAAFSGLLRKVD